MPRSTTSIRRRTDSLGLLKYGAASSSTRDGDFSVWPFGVLGFSGATPSLMLETAMALIVGFALARGNRVNRFTLRQANVR
jgi:hypothetical protein